MTVRTPLTDVPGPRARRRQRILTIVGAVLLVAAAYAVYRRLDDRGQLDGDRWDVFTQWGVQRFYLTGLWNTVRAAALAGAVALSFGLLLALARLAQSPVTRLVAGDYVETFRAVPLVLLMFFSLLALPKLGVDWVSPYWAVVIGLVAYNSAVFAEIFRAGIHALPRGQSEAAASIGLRYWQSMRHVIVPQALRAMIPALVAQLVVLLKDTSLGALLAYEELLRRGQITGEYARNPLQALFVAGMLYVPIVFSLNRFARWLEQRQRRGPAAILPEETAHALVEAQMAQLQPSAVADPT
jgi:glutamate transport system permease protein